MMRSDAGDAAYERERENIGSARAEAGPASPRRGFAHKIRKIDTIFVQPLILHKNGVKQEQACQTCLS